MSEEFWVSGIDFKTFKLEPGSLTTAFLTADDPERKEAIHVIEKAAFDKTEKALRVAMKELQEVIDWADKESDFGLVAAIKVTQKQIKEILGEK